MLNGGTVSFLFFDSTGRGLKCQNFLQGACHDLMDDQLYFFRIVMNGVIYAFLGRLQAGELTFYLGIS